jgi:putative FmdB family regulatory protein
MPLYDYFCKSCNNDFEIRHEMMFEGKIHCVFCGSKETIKKVSMVNVNTLKGTDNDLQRTMQSHNSRFSAPKEKLQKALDAMKPDKTSDVVDSGHCVQETRRELEAIYGGIFDSKTRKSTGHSHGEKCCCHHHSKKEKE